MVAGIILNGRVYDAAQKGAKIALSWEQNIQAVDYLVVPKGSKNRDAAMRLIDTMTVAENQAKVANMIAYSPTNLDGLQGRSTPSSSRGSARRRRTSRRASS